MFKFDDAELALVAAAVIKFNKYAGAYSVAEIVAEMKLTAYGALDPVSLGYVSMRGYVLSAFRCSTGETGIKASVNVSILAEG